MKLKESLNLMNKNIILKLILIFAVLSSGAAFNVLGQPDQYPYHMAGQPAQYSDQTPGNAPIPTNPTTPESLGMQTPSAMASQFSPTAQEKSQGVITSTQQLAYAAAPSSSYATASYATATSPTVTVPTGTYAPNSLYVFYAPQTTAGCYLNANVPLWMRISGSGNLWFYEWYPDGRPVTKYAGNVYYPGWYERWFYADVPGWHILQYYCNGWSNYAYIYVYGSYPATSYPQTSYQPVTQPYPYPYTYPYTYPYQYPYSFGQTKWIVTYPSTGHTYHPPPTDHDHPPNDHSGHDDNSNDHMH
jgi:hypothetical protein